MSFSFLDLNQTTRDEMIVEITNDITNNQLYLSKRLSSNGVAGYPELLKMAVQQHDEVWLAEQLMQQNRLNQIEQTSRGQRKVPINAAITLAEGEFNRYYMRALCRIAIIDGLKLEVYRAKAVDINRTESQNKIGQIIDPKTLLDDLRDSIGVDSALGLPAGPNSGLSIKLVN
ncbi:hypothetical protein E0H82_03970 [Acinetobacter sp. ANC 4910]|uniref:hypothetical protein n=1 Tax=Acinetobacter sp. ANC 4910 TaxID=2529850 RepID=UPI00103E9B9F|nr:hypothetical protein [Acinetobacter sp. ANC 4910]TCB36874.1 hypothetical protein E0H82_03970 [Acinetobacter sp. ANC 4910]